MTALPLAELADDGLVVTVEVCGQQLLDARGRPLLVRVEQLPTPGPWQCCLVQGLTAIAHVERVRLGAGAIPVVEVTAGAWPPRERAAELEQAEAEAMNAWARYAAARRALDDVLAEYAAIKLELAVRREESEK